MLSPELLRDLDAAWPPPRRGLFGSKPPADVPPALESVICRAAESGDDAWVHVLLPLAWVSAGPLRTRLLDGIAAILARLPWRRWVQVDERARPQWLSWLRSNLPVAEHVHAGERGWMRSASLDAIRAELGDHFAGLVLASMHPNGRVRQAAVGALDGDARALPALLLRANDWVAPVRDDAIARLHRLADPVNVDAWLRVLPLALRLDACGRAAHGPLIDRIGTIFIDSPGRARLLAAVRSGDARTARVAASLAVRVYGTGDRELAAALLRCPDVVVRCRAVVPGSSVLDDELLGLALGDPVATIRVRALDVLRERHPDRFAERLRTACFDRAASVREVAIHHLRKAGLLDAEGLAAEARERIAAGRGDVLAALLLLRDLVGDAGAVEASALAGHPSGFVRLCAKRCLIRALPAGAPIDDRLLDDPSPKVARGLIALLRTRGVEPDPARIARRIEESPTDVEACAWLGTLARCAVWGALPHLVRALGDRRPAVAALARRHIDARLRTTFRAHVSVDAGALRDLADAVRACRDPRAAAVIEWASAMTGRRGWAP